MSKYTVEQFNDVRRLVSQESMRVIDACKEVGTTTNAYFAHRRRHPEFKDAPVKRAHRKQVPVLTQIPLQSSSKVFAFYGSPSEVADVIKSMQ